MSYFESTEQSCLIVLREKTGNCYNFQVNVRFLCQSRNPV